MSPQPGILFIHPGAGYASDSNVDAMIMRYLDKGRFSVHVACPPRAEPGRRAAADVFSSIAGVQVRTMTFAPTLRHSSQLRLLRAALGDSVVAARNFVGLARFIKANNIRVLHCNESPRDSSYSLALARLTGAKVAIHVHALPGDWMRPLTLRNMARCDVLIGVSGAVARGLVAMGYPAEKTVAVRNGIEVRRWDPGLSGAPLRAELGIAPGTPVVATIARVYPGKGFVEVIRALGSISAEVPDFRLLVVGEDDRAATPGMSSHTAELKALAQALGVADRVIFTGFRRDIDRVLAAADIFAMPSPSEACSLAYLEALAMRVPVVALDSAGTPELVEHGVCGLLSAPGDIPALAANLRALLADGQLRQRMGASGRARVEEHFTQERVARDMSRVYEGLLANRLSAVALRPNEQELNLATDPARRYPRYHEAGH